MIVLSYIEHELNDLMEFTPVARAVNWSSAYSAAEHRRARQHSASMKEHSNVFTVDTLSKAKALITKRR